MPRDLMSTLFWIFFTLISLLQKVNIREFLRELLKRQRTITQRETRKFFMSFGES